MKPNHNKNRRLKLRNIVANEDRILIGSAEEASSKAIRSSKALGITFKIIKGNKIISVRSDESEVVERIISKSPIDISKLKKGMSLERM